MKNKSFKHVSNLWNDAEAAKLNGVERLVYRSNKLGSDQRITNTGGGNTSSKISETDPLTGEKVEVLWVKGSGGDLRTSTRENFSSLYQGQIDRPCKNPTVRRERQRFEITGGRRHGRRLQPHDVQPESARQLH